MFGTGVIFSNNSRQTEWNNQEKQEQFGGQRELLTSWKKLEDMEGPPIYSAPPPKKCQPGT